MPTKPIIPDAATQEPVINEEAINNILFVLSGFTPRLKAFSSPKVSIFRSSEKNIRVKMPNMTRMAVIIIVKLFAEDKSPINHIIIL